MDPQNPPAPNDAPADNTPPAATQDDEWLLANEEFKTEHEVPEPEKKQPKKDDKTDPEKPDPEKDKKPVDDEAAKKAQEEADAEAKKKTEEEEAEKAKNETPEQTKARHEKEAAEKKEAEEVAAATNRTPEADSSVRDQRAAVREMQADLKATKNDVREKMFDDLQTELTDADGDPIRTIEDVMKLMNPNTRKPFTEEEAASYLLQAQAHLDKQIKEAEGKIEEIAEVNLGLKDDADTVRGKYSELFKAFAQSPNPQLKNLQKELYAAFQDTLIKDEKSGIIVKAPVSMVRFYDTALAGYVKLAQQLEAQAKAKDKPDEAAKTAATEQKKTERKQDQTDREDITSTGKSDTRDPEDKEWDAAAKDYYEN
jgi:hypothetical protein